MEILLSADDLADRFDRLRSADQLDDTAARNDWQWSPDYGIDRAFDEYLVPAIRARYRD